MKIKAIIDPLPQKQEPEEENQDRELLVDDAADPAIANATARLNTLRLRKQEMQRSHKTNIARLELEISQAKTYLAALRTNKARTKMGGTWTS